MVAHTLARRAMSSLAARAAPAASRFAHVPRGPEDAILGVTLAYNADKNAEKINVGVGAYRTDEGRPLVLSAVRKAEKRIIESDLNMEYLPVIGSQSFIRKSVALAFGDDSQHVKDGCYAGIQALSGTGACRMAAVLIARFLEDAGGQRPLVLMPDPTWANHANIFRDGGCDVGKYRYYDPVTRAVDFEGCVRALEEAPDGAAVLLQATAHNPTGCDLSEAQWEEISALLMRKRMLPVFDMAYQGFTSGNVDVDAMAVRRFVDDGHRVVLAQSFSKNFGLYAHRVGCLSVLTDSREEADAVNSQLKIIARPMYSNPPVHGVRVVDAILGDGELEAVWRAELAEMAGRIIRARMDLKTCLEEEGSGLSWDHIVDQKGMFCFSGLTPTQVKRLSDEYSVYMTGNGRISMAGVTLGNVHRLAHAIHQVTM